MGLEPGDPVNADRVRRALHRVLVTRAHWLALWLALWLAHSLAQLLPHVDDARRQQAELAEGVSRRLHATREAVRVSAEDAATAAA